ncbi:hypothetical protein [Rhodoferax sp. WC2427]|uniref:hypothetical protein n=1 Tax=Rhodoferax sp. WC2427 TaxID=3234144 RepID=UPI003467202C
MRRFFLILMIALLPLRGWAGEVMAMDILAQHAPAIQKVAAHAHHTVESSTFDMEMQADCHGAAEAAHSDADASTSHCGTCPLCQMCHTVAAPAPFFAIPTPWLPHAQPTTGPARFASAPAAFALKPPIS